MWMGLTKFSHPFTSRIVFCWGQREMHSPWPWGRKQIAKLTGSEKKLLEAQSRQPLPQPPSTASKNWSHICKRMKSASNYKYRKRSRPTDEDWSLSNLCVQPLSLALHLPSFYFLSIMSHESSFSFPLFSLCLLNCSWVPFRVFILFILFIFCDCSKD